MTFASEVSFRSPESLIELENRVEILLKVIG